MSRFNSLRIPAMLAMGRLVRSMRDMQYIKPVRITSARGFIGQDCPVHLPGQQIGKLTKDRDEAAVDASDDLALLNFGEVRVRRRRGAGLDGGHLVDRLDGGLFGIGGHCHCERFASSWVKLRR